MAKPSGFRAPEDFGKKGAVPGMPGAGRPKKEEKPLEGSTNMPDGGMPAFGKPRKQGDAQSPEEMSKAKCIGDALRGSSSAPAISDDTD